MLRYIFLKLSGFTGKKEFSLSSSCNHMLTFCPASTAKKEFRRGRTKNEPRLQQKRSYSFPSASTRRTFSRNGSRGQTKTKPYIPGCQGLGMTQKTSYHKHTDKDTKDSKSPKSAHSQTCSSNTKKHHTAKSELKGKYKEISGFDDSERYELESARPRRSQSELIFNVFDYVARDVDLTDYLQPSNLRPFGSNDNIFLPLLMSPKNLSISQDNPHYLESVTDVDNADHDNLNMNNEDIEEIRQSPINKVKKVKGYKEILKKHKELTPENPSRTKVSAMSRSLDRSDIDEGPKNESKNEMECHECRKMPWTKASVKIEPPPFLTKREDKFSSISFGDMSLCTKRNIAIYGRLQPPWPAYSDHIKDMTNRNSFSSSPGTSPGTVPESFDDNTDPLQSTKQKLSLLQTRNISTDKLKVLNDKPKALKKEEVIKNNLPQRRTMSLQHINTGRDLSPSTENIPKITKSSVFVSKAFNKNPVTHSLVSLRTKDLNLCPSQNYTKSSNKMIRKFEPKPCNPPEKKRRCFVPSKVRLKPPKCTPKRYDCFMPPPCIRADDCLEEHPKKLPLIKTNDCECYEPKIPNEAPKLKKLNLKFFDEPRVCPCVPKECPCEPPPRADDFAKPKEKKLFPYTPAECACIEPPPMIDIPLIRLQKVCEPEEKCYPKKPCVVEVCEDKIRADDCLVESIKKLPPLNIGDCRCMEPPVPDINPKLRRLNMEFIDPPRICPCVPLCECPEAPVRADDCAEEKVKKLVPIKPKDCPCIEPPRMINVPLKRLQKVCEPAVCRPVKECPVETCEDKFRADMCLVERPKKLPKFQPSNCECKETHVPKENPKLKRLKMKFEDEPRVCPCVPVVCPCNPPIRADDLTKPRERKLIPYVAKDCQCVEPPPMKDVPLIRLQKVCEPEEKCYPKKPCVVEICEDKIRADDCMRELPKKLRPLEPKPCPCLDFKMNEGPKLKRLDLAVPEPPRICPRPKVCPPPEKCARADDCVPQKVKKLPRIKPKDCPCIEQPMVDVKPLRRLKCREEPEECLPADPCTDFPRADWGCWEYLQDVEEADKGYNVKRSKHVSYKQKRKFNTDSRVSVQSRNIVVNQAVNSNDQKITKYFSNPIRSTIRDRSIGPKPINKASTLPRDTCINNIRSPKSPNLIKEEKSTKVRPTGLDLNRNKSLPTLFLLKELDEIKTKKLISKSRQPASMSLTPPPNHPSSNLAKPNVRKLSTVVLGTKKISNCCPGAAQASSESKKDDKEDPSKCNKTNKKTCTKMSKCPGPMIMKNCPQKEERSCKVDRQLVCCEKKTVPNPAFSECMEEEIQPYSNTSQWSCDRKEYGFEPNPKKPYEPLDTVKEKKKFSTSSVHNSNSPNGNADHPIVNYFSARYPKTEVVGQQKRSRGSVLDRIGNDGVPKDSSKRESSTFSETMSDVTGCRLVRKDCVPIKENPKVLSQKSNYTVTGVSCKKMFTRNKVYSTLLFNTSGLRCRANVDTISIRNLSTFNIASTSVVRGKELVPLTEPFRRMYSDDQHDDNEKKSPRAKKNCAKFKMSNCPEKTERPCKMLPQEIVCNKKPQAPYPSFSELMDDEMEDRLNECPMEREKIQHLQPRYSIPYHKPEIFTMEGVQQGRIDPKIEEECVREKLCMENQGLTQNCENFGQYVKPLKSKKFFKDKNKDCERIAELKKTGKWPPKNYRRFSTSIAGSLNFQGRKLCSSVHALNPPRATKKEEHLVQAHQIENETEVKSKNVDIRSFHALNKNSNPSLTDEAQNDTKQTLSAELDKPFKCTKLNNLQWGIDNYQKWYRLQKRNNFPHFAKRYYYYRRGVVHSKIKLSNIEVQKQLSTSSVKVPLENTDVFTQRCISTAMTLAKNNKHKLIRFPLYPKPSKKCPKFKMPNCPQPVKEVKQCQQQTKNNQNVSTLQPKYPSVPEVDTSSIPPYTSKKESSWENECLIHFSGKEKKGKSWDCSSVERPFIRLNSSSLEPVESRIPKYINDGEREMMPCTPCGEVFIHRLHMKARGCLKKGPDSRLKCPKFPLPFPCKLGEGGPKKPYPVESCDPPSYDQSCQPCQPCSSSQKAQQVCPPPVTNLWQRIVNYFKARPNCPSPDEWKKRALREKAEKAAKAAGLTLCDPKDLHQNVDNRTSEREAVRCSKIDSSSNCFPARKNPCKISTRHYSSGFNWDASEELNKIIEEEKKKQLSKQPTPVLKDEVNHDDETNQKCPDSLFESILKEAILNRNSLSCLEKFSDGETYDKSVNYTLKIQQSDMDFLNDCIKQHSNEENPSIHGVKISDLQDYFNRIDTLSEICYEELENMKTKSMVQELNKLLKENQKPQKKN